MVRGFQSGRREFRTLHAMYRSKAGRCVAAVSASGVWRLSEQSAKDPANMYRLVTFCFVHIIFCIFLLPYQMTWVLKYSQDFVLARGFASCLHFSLHPGFGYFAPAWGVAGHSDQTAFMMRFQGLCQADADSIARIA